MKQLADHPEIQCAERTGYPTWMQGEWTGGESEEDEDDEWGEED